MVYRSEEEGEKEEGRLSGYGSEEGLVEEGGSRAGGPRGASVMVRGRADGDSEWSRGS